MIKEQCVYEQENEADYRQKLALEKEREKQYCESEQGAFEAAMLHLDDTAAFCDGDGLGEADVDQSPYWENDDGEGAEAIRSCDCPSAWSNQSYYSTQKHNARRRLIRYNPCLVRVFDLVLKNGTNRKESIWELMHSGTAVLGGASQKRKAQQKRMKKRDRQRRWRARKWRHANTPQK